MAENNTMTPTTITIYTDGSARPNPGKAGYGFYAEDNLKNVYNGYGPVGVHSSNNEAELTALLRSLQYIETLTGIIAIEYFIDSRYVLDGIVSLRTWKKNNWNTSTGSVVANLSLWKEVDIILESYSARQVKISYNWLRGHSGVKGNDSADLNSNKGRIALELGDLNNVVTVDYYDPDAVAITPPVVSNNKLVKVKKKTTSMKLTPLLTGKKWVFNTNQTKQVDDGRYFYTSSTYKNSEELNHKNLGKRSPDTHYSIFLSDKPIVELDTLRDKFNDHFSGLTIPVVVYLDILTKGTIWAEIEESQNKYTTIKNNLACLPDSTVVGEVRWPPKLYFKLDGIFGYGFSLIAKYERRAPEVIYKDITEHFLATVNGKQSLHADFTNGLTLVTLKDAIIKDDIKTDVKLNPGVDIPSRNNFSTMLKQTKDPIKVTLLCFDITENSYRIATIVEYEKLTGIYYTPDANYRLITNAFSKK